MKEFDNIELKFRSSEFNSVSNEFLHDSEFNPIKTEIDYGKEFSNESNSNSQTNNQTSETNTANNTNPLNNSSNLSSIQEELLRKGSAIAVGTSMGTAAVSALALCVASAGVGGVYSNNPNMNISQVESMYEEVFEEPQVIDNNVPPADLPPANDAADNKEEVKKENKEQVKKENNNVKTLESKPEPIKKFTVSAVNYDGVYDGKKHSGNISNIPDGAVVKYGKSKEKIDLDNVPEYKNAGEYTVYYKVSKEGYEPYIGDFKIKIDKKIIDPPVPLIEETTYNGKMQSPKFIDDRGFRYFGTLSAMNAGTYDIKIKLNDSSNYEWADGNNDEKIVSWVIKPREVTVEWNGKEDYKYDGQKHSIDVTLGNIAPGDYVDFNVEGNSATEPGEYMAEITSLDRSDNYILPKNNSFEWKVSK